jgi:hypothetical protein
VSDKSGEAPCYVAKGPCGHYYWCAVDRPEMRAQTAKDIGKILRREGHAVERKTVQWVRDGGLDWTPKCKAGVCAGVDERSGR